MFPGCWAVLQLPCCHAAQASKGNYYKTFGTGGRPTQYVQYSVPQKGLSEARGRQDAVSRNLQGQDFLRNSVEREESWIMRR